MNVKNFLIAGFVGGIVEYLLGWLLWGELFRDCLPLHDDKDMNMLFIFLGCMTFAFFMSYVFTQWAQISKPVTGLKAGAIFGIFLGLYSNFFQNSLQLNPNYQMMLIDIALTVFCGAIVGAVIALVNGKLK